MSSVLLALACACPAPDERFVPGPDPTFTVLVDIDTNAARCADGAWVEEAEYTDIDGEYDYYAALCDCNWCAEEYAGKDYCVRAEDLEAWREESCPSCKLELYEPGYTDFIYASVRCSAPDCQD